MNEGWKLNDDDEEKKEDEMGLWLLVIIMCAAGMWIGITSSEQKYDVSAFVGYLTAW